MLKNPLFLAFLASLFFGVFMAPFKLAKNSGPGSDVIIFLGIGVAIVGSIWKFIEGGALSWSTELMSYATSSGVIWALGCISVLMALKSPGGHIALVTPIYNVNTLWAMALGLIFFGEYHKVSVPYAVTGAVLITLGGGFTALAKQ